MKTLTSADDRLLMQGHKRMVLDGVITFFVQQDEKHLANSAIEHRYILLSDLLQSNADGYDIIGMH